MEKIDIQKIYEETKKHFKKAYESLNMRKAFNEEYTAISDIIPGYNACDLEFGSFDKDNFAVLFVDMRNSTVRAKKIGAEKTFLTMHAYIPALLMVVKHYEGEVIDIMGDGIMVFWGGKKLNITKAEAVKRAGLCGRDILKVRVDVINRILLENKIEWEIDLGVGVAYGDVIVTKIGINEFYDVKAFGDCVNLASKYSDNCNEVKVSKQVKNLWPTGKNGRISFKQNGDGYILYSK